MLGEAAIALHRVACELDSVRDTLTAHGGGFFASEERARPYEDLGLLGEEMDELTERLSAELGPEHEAVTAFAGARAAVRDLVGNLELLKDLEGHGVLNVRKLADDTIAQIGAQRSSFDACRDRFMDALRDLRAEE